MRAPTRTPTRTLTPTGTGTLKGGKDTKCKPYCWPSGGGAVRNINFNWLSLKNQTFQIPLTHDVAQLDCF